MLKTKISIIASSIMIGNAASAIVDNPYYMPKKGMAYAIGTVVYGTGHGEQEPSGDRDFEFLGGEWDSQFIIGYGINDKLSFSIRNNYDNAHVSDKVENMPYLVGEPLLGLTYRAYKNNKMVVDLTGETTIGISDNTEGVNPDDTTDNTDNPLVRTEEDFGFNFTARLGYDFGKAKLAGTVGFAYDLGPTITGKIIQTATATDFTQVKDYDARTDYYINLEGNYQFNKTYSMNAGVLYYQIGEWDYTETTEGTYGGLPYNTETEGKSNEDRDGDITLTLKGNYHKSENAVISALLSYHIEGEDITGDLNDDYLLIGATVGVEF